MPGTEAAVNYRELTRAVVAEVLGWTGGTRGLSAALRSELLRLVPHVMVHPLDRQEYIAHLNTARRDSGREDELLDLTDPITVPTESFIESGVAALDDPHLGVLAVDPLLVNTFAELIDSLEESEELGLYWWDEMSRVGATAYPELPFIAPSLAQAPFPPTGPDAAPPVTPGAPVPRTGWRMRPYLPWAITAASLVVAVISVWWAGRGGERITVPKGEFAASTELSRTGTLGADHVYALAVRAPEDGFVTVILLPPDGPPLTVYPGYGAADIPVDKGQAARVDSLAARSGTRIVAFVTGTPASETVRKAVDKLRGVEKLAPEDARRAVLDALRVARQPWVAVSDVTTIP